MSIYLCPLCQEEMELGEAGSHLVSEHMDTMLVMLVMYSDENDFSYETLSYLCDSIGYHKIGIEDINRVACSYIQTDKKEEVCPICLEPLGSSGAGEALGNSGAVEPFNNGAEEAVIMQLKHCKHLFCRPCITLWLKEHTTCPLCKDDLKEIA